MRVFATEEIKQIVNGNFVSLSEIIYSGKKSKYFEFFYVYCFILHTLY